MNTVNATVNTVVVYLMAAQVKVQEAMQEEDGMEILQVLGIATVALLILSVLIARSNGWGTSISGHITNYISRLSR